MLLFMPAVVGGARELASDGTVHPAWSRQLLHCLNPELGGKIMLNNKGRLDFRHFVSTYGRTGGVEWFYTK